MPAPSRRSGFGPGGGTSAGMTVTNGRPVNLAGDRSPSVGRYAAIRALV